MGIACCPRLRSLCAPQTSSLRSREWKRAVCAPRCHRHHLEFHVHVRSPAGRPRPVPRSPRSRVNLSHCPRHKQHRWLPPSCSRHETWIRAPTSPKSHATRAMRLCSRTSASSAASCSRAEGSRAEPLRRRGRYLNESNLVATAAQSGPCSSRCQRSRHRFGRRRSSSARAPPSSMSREQRR